MINSAKLRGRIVEKYTTQTAFANAIGMLPQSVSMRLTGVTEFSREDIFTWCKALDIPTSEIGDYFFAE